MHSKANVWWRYLACPKCGMDNTLLVHTRNDLQVKCVNCKNVFTKEELFAIKEKTPISEMLLRRLKHVTV